MRRNECEAQQKAWVISNEPINSPEIKRAGLIMLVSEARNLSAKIPAQEKSVLPPIISGLYKDLAQHFDSLATTCNKYTKYDLMQNELTFNRISEIFKTLANCCELQEQHKKSAHYSGIHITFQTSVKRQELLNNKKVLLSYASHYHEKSLLEEETYHTPLELNKKAENLTNDIFYLTKTPLLLQLLHTLYNQLADLYSISDINQDGIKKTHQQIAETHLELSALSEQKQEKEYHLIYAKRHSDSDNLGEREKEPSCLRKKAKLLLESSQTTMNNHELPAKLNRLHLFDSKKNPCSYFFNTSTTNNLGEQQPTEKTIAPKS